MTEKEMKRFSRAELLELLIDQMKENEELQKKLDEANKRLEDRKIIIENSGSIAEAALKLNGIFEAAEKAAAQYIENVKASKSKSQD